jgi:hypothetical protein
MVKPRRDAIFWIPRILSILFLLFLAMFSLDVFGNGYSFWETIVGLFMHNIPVFVLLIVLIIAWKRDLVGAIFYALAGLLYIGSLIYSAGRGNGEWYMLTWSIFIAGPAFAIAALFLIGWRRKRKVISQ